MISRILTGAALTGIVLATGCGGGGSAGTPGISGAVPSIGAPSIGVPSGKARGSFAASFLIPYSEGRASAASIRSAESSRSPKYLSPGTTGLQILIGNGTTSAVSGAAETATLSTAIAAGGFTTTSETIFLNGGSFATVPVIGQTLDITGATGGLSATDLFTITGVAANGTQLTGTYASTIGAGAAAVNALVSLNAVSASAGQTAVVGTLTAPLALAPGTTTKAIPSTVNGATASSTVTYSFGPSTTAGYYTFSAVFSNFTPSITETVGVVTTDLSNNNYVLSEAQGTVSIPASGVGEPATAFVLSPVVANVFVPTPTLVTLASKTAYTSITGTLALGALETTVFPTDELGYVIPSGSGTPENYTSLAFTAATSGNLTFQLWTAGVGSPPVSNTSLTVLPSGTPTIGGGAATATITSLGSFLTNILTPSAPYSLSTNGAIPNGVTFGGMGTTTNSAGTPLTITCAANPSSSVAWNAVLTSTNAGTVTGYTYTYGTNYPALTKTIPLTPINCSSGFVVPIN